MTKLIATLTLTALLCPVLMAHDRYTVTIEGLMGQLRSRRAATDYKLTGRFVRVADSGQRFSYKFSMRARSFSNVLKVFYEVTDPISARERFLLESNVNGRITVRMGHAGGQGPRTLSFDEWGEPLLDSDFSYEDLLEAYLLWEKQTLVREETCGTRNCYVVKSEPGAADKSHYSSITSWLDSEFYYTVRVEKILRSSGTTKKFVCFGLRESQGLWSPSQIEVRTTGRSGSTFFIVSRGSGKANVPASAFDAALLTKQ